MKETPRDEEDRAWNGEDPLELLREELGYLAQFHDALLELVPDGVAVLDESLRVRAANDAFRRFAGPGAGGDAAGLAGHPLLLAEVAPGLPLEDALRTLAREGGARTFDRIEWIDSATGRRIACFGKASAWDADDPDSGRLLLWLRPATAREERTHYEPSPPPSPAGGETFVKNAVIRSALTSVPVPMTPEAITAPDRLRLWPRPKTRKVLVADRSPWDAVILSRALRDMGLTDITIVEKGSEAWEKSDPAEYGLVVVVFPDEERDEMIDLCRRLTAYAPTVPVLVMAERAATAREIVGELPLLGILGKVDREENLGAVAKALFAEEEEADVGMDEEVASRPETPEGDMWRVVLLGAGDGHVPLIRRIDAAPNVRLALVYDPDGKAPGLARARDLYVPCASRPESADFDRPIHAVVLGDDHLERVIAELGLEDAALLTPAELDVFLENPKRFLEGVAGGDEDEGAAAFDEPVRPHETSPRPEAMREAARTADAILPAAGQAGAPDLGITGLLDALDLILDFRRFGARVLDIALEMAGGATGSLMLIDDEARELSIVASKGIPPAVARKTRQRLGEGIAGRVAESGEPLLLQGRVGDRRFRGMGGRPDIQSSVCVPIFSGTRIIGTLSVNCPAKSSTLGEAERDRIAEMGRQIGGALEQSRQLERSRARSFELSVRGEIEAIAYSREELDRKLALIADKVVEMLELDSCAIYLSEPETRELMLRAAAGFTVDPLGAIRIPHGAGAVGHVARDHRPLTLRTDPSDEGPVRTSITVPILHQTELSGVVSIEDISGERTDENRLALVSSIASSVGILIGGACAHAASKKKVTMLSAIGEMGVAFTAARDRVGLAKLVAFCAATVLESDVATVRLLQPGETWSEGNLAALELLASQGTSLPDAEEPLASLDGTMVGVAATRGKPCRDQDVRTDDVRHLLERAHTASCLALPLLSGDDLVGSIVVYRVAGADRRDVGYREHEIEVGVRLADYAAAAALQFLPREEE